MKYIGIDPGIHGGVGWTGDDGAAAEAMPDTDRGILDLLAAHRQGAVAVIEQVHSTPQQGVVSVATFVGNYRALRMALTAVGIPYLEVAPNKWQRALGVLAPPLPSRQFCTAAERSRRQREHKAALKACAEQLFPGLSVTNATADALLLATFCARQDWRGITQKEHQR